MITIGIDEVGRGCWAGPLVAGAVALNKPIAGLTDSKLLSAMRRQQLAAEIYQSATAWGLGWVSAAEVDALGLTAAVSLAMDRALQAVAIDADDVIIDGNYNFLPHIKHTRTIVKADLSEPSVSAASIIAKVARDSWMIEASLRYPGYGFERHVGYGTSKHRAALYELGICELHRKSFKPVRQLC